MIYKQRLKINFDEKNLKIKSKFKVENSNFGW